MSFSKFNKSGIISGYDFYKEQELIVMLDTGDLYSVRPTEKSLVITHISGNHKPSLIKIVGNVLYKINSSMGGANLYTITENACLKEIGGTTLSDLYYGPILDATLLSDSIRERVVAVCGMRPSTVREFFMSRRIIKQKIGNTDILCKNMLEVQLNNKPGLLISSVFNTKVLITTTPNTLEETKESLQIDTSKPTIYAKSFNDILIQVTTLSINIIKGNILLDTKEVINVLTTVSTITINGEILIEVICNRDNLIIYSISSEGKLIEVYSSIVEGKSLAVKNNLFYCFTNHNIIVFDVNSKKVVNDIPLNIEEEITVKTEIMNDIAFIGTKGGYLIAFSLSKGQVNSYIRISKDPVNIGPLISNIVLAWTRNEFFAVEFTDSLQRFSRINIKSAIRDCIRFDKYYLYMDCEGQVFNFKVTDDEPFISSKILLTSNPPDTFTRVVHCPKHELYCLVIENMEGKSSMCLYSEDFVECLQQTIFLHNRFKEILPFTFTINFGLYIDSILILKSEREGSSLELYTRDKENFTLPVWSSKFTFEQQIINMVFMAPCYLVVVGDCVLYILTIVIRGKNFILDPFHTKQLREPVRIH